MEDNEIVMGEGMGALSLSITKHIALGLPVTYRLGEITANLMTKDIELMHAVSSNNIKVGQYRHTHNQPDYCMDRKLIFTYVYKLR